VDEYKGIAQEMIGRYGWWLIGGLGALLFQSTIQKAIDGFLIFVGNDYNEDDVVKVDEKPGRIVRVGIWKTVFFIYDVDKNGKVTGGSKLVVANDKLKDIKIEKPLQNLKLEKKDD